MHVKVVAVQGGGHLQDGKREKLVGFQNLFNAKLPCFVPNSIMMKIKKN